MLASATGLLAHPQREPRAEGIGSAAHAAPAAGGGCEFPADAKVMRMRTAQGLKQDAGPMPRATRLTQPLFASNRS